MPWSVVVQNLILLSVALGLALDWNTGWPFALLTFWLRPDDEKSDEFKGDLPED